MTRWSWSTSSVRTVALIGYALYIASVAFLVWTPSPSFPGGVIARVLALATRVGVTLEAAQVEFALNILMLVPLSLVGGLVFHHLRLADWTAIGFGASLIIEAVQRLLLPTRFGSSRDIVANTVGSFLGALLLVLALRILKQSSRARARATPPVLR